MNPVHLSLALALLLNAHAHGAILHVDASASPGGDGLSWATAFRSPHGALAAAQVGDEVRIAQGVYRPAPAGGDRGATFTLKTGIAIRGGYGGLGSPTPDLQDPAQFPTVLSGDLHGDDGPQFTNRDDNSHHIATLDLGETVTLEYLGEVTLDGLTFRGGETDVVSGLHDRGGALKAIAPKGAGLDAAARITVTRCRFEDCRALRGGAAHTRDIVPRFEDCVFEGNDAVTGGAAEHIFIAFFADFPTATFLRCDFIGNTATTGGGLAHSGSNAWIESCRFIGNSANFAGGFVTPGSEHVTLVNCVFAGNHAISGAAVFDDGSRTTTLINCTLWGNVATAAPAPGNGSIVESRAGELLALRNCVVWGNEGASPQINSFFEEVTFSAVEDMEAGAGNLAVDPRFVDAPGGDFRLTPFSPCADAGDGGSLPVSVTTDVRGRTRVVDDLLAPGDAVDMGAYERQACPGDANGDEAVNFADLNIVLSEFGKAAPVGTLAGDVTGDGAVNFEDLNVALSAFGGVCAD